MDGAGAQQADVTASPFPVWVSQQHLPPPKRAAILILQTRKLRHRWVTCPESQLETKTWDLNPLLTLPGNLADSSPTCAFGSKQTKAHIGQVCAHCPPSTWYIGRRGLSHTRGTGEGSYGHRQGLGCQGRGKTVQERVMHGGQKLGAGNSDIGLAGAQCLLYYTDF